MFELIIGLEVHIQLNTKTKLFCSCKTSFGEKPNTNTCPTCLGLPGSLPVMNKEAAIKAMKFANGINAKINDNSKFERKNYFYPDLPTGYQISQLEVPIVEGGEVIIKTKEGKDKTIHLNRAHLETDAGKNIHEQNSSYVDLNRAGTPLLEIVTEPDFRSIEEVTSYLKQLHSIVRYLDISDANMQEGSFRCDVNISIRPKGEDKLYTRCEIKNLNSFKFIEKAIAYEYQRQVEAWEDGIYEKEVVQETRKFDTDKLITFSMRGKEEAMDYRYFPDPDLKPIKLLPEMYEIAKDIPEMPRVKKIRYVDELKIKEEDAERIVSDIEICNIFEDFVNGGLDPKLVISWLLVEYLGRINKDSYKDRTSSITLSDLSSIIELIQKDKISGKAGKDILDYIVEKRENIEETVEMIVKKLNLEQMSDTSELENIVQMVIDRNPAVVAEFNNGKTKAIGSLVGQVLKETQGKANPKLVNELLNKKMRG
jgi:aspartyl-tRNA(Asn)/glutamyl-tRNA(Gln) amidotransferase subunit B